MRLRLAALLCLCAAARPAAAQNITGSILGTVTDPSGGSVAGARIAVIQTATNTRHETATNDRGDYEVPLLPPGAYRIVATANGFQTLERQGVQLNVGNRLQVNFNLLVGQTNESIVVTGSAELVEAGTAALGASFSSRSVEELPMRGRFALQLAALVPGVQINPQAVGAGSAALTGADFSVNGGRFRTNEFLIDGVSSSLPRNNDLVALPLPEGVSELKIHTNSYSAEFGRTGGGVFNLVTKGGGNDFHGNLFEFLSADELNANAWFANARGQKKGNSRRNIYGAAISGPIRRNRTFFYADYQGIQSSGTGGTGTATVPIEEFRQGNFRNLVTNTGAAKVIYDPITTQAVSGGFTRTPFPGNQIPSSRIDPAARNLIKLYPAPNSAGTGAAQVNNFNFTSPSRSHTDQFTGRVDHEFSSNHRIFGRYTMHKSTSTVFPDYGTLGDTPLGYNPGSRGQSATLNDTYTFSPTLLLNARLGFTRQLDLRTPLHEGINLASLGFNPAIDAVRVESSLPNFGPSGYGALGPASGDRIRLGNDIWHLNSDLTAIRSGHTLKFGAEGRMYNQTAFQAGADQGVFSFSPAFTQGPNPLQATATAGDSIASFLLGLGAGSMASTPRLAIRNFYWGAFVNDDWKVSQKLTLNLGLRWEMETARTERYNRFSTFDFTRAFPIAVPALPGLKGVMTRAGQEGEPRRQVDAAPYNFSPRFGFAYRLTPKTVARGGYGIFYSPVFGYTSGANFGSSGALISTPWVSSLDGVTPLNYLNNPFPNGALIASQDPVDRYQMGQGVVINDRRNVNNTYTQQWNFNLQRELPGNVLIEGAYAGNKGTRLPVGIQFNQLDPVYQAQGASLTTLVPNPFFGIVREGTLAASTVQRGQLLRPYPQYQGIGNNMQNRADSIYHSFTLRVEKRFSHGFMGQVSYTNGKIIDTSSGRLVNYTAFVPPVQNSYDLRAERSISEGDVSQRLVLFGDWQLPFGKGMRFGAGAHSVLQHALGGWSLNAVATFHTGFPINLTSLGNSGVYGASLRPNSTGRSAAKSGPPQDRLNSYFDTTAFTLPPAFTFGNTSRTLADVRGPGRAQADVTLQKDIHFTERVYFRLRAECYNLTNTPFFDQPALIVGNANLGVISAARLQRAYQIAGKLIW